MVEVRMSGELSLVEWNSDRTLEVTLGYYRKMLRGHTLVETVFPNLTHFISSSNVIESFVNSKTRLLISSDVRIAGSGEEDLGRSWAIIFNLQRLRLLNSCILSIMQVDGNTDDLVKFQSLYSITENTKR